MICQCRNPFSVCQRLTVTPCLLRSTYALLQKQNPRINNTLNNGNFPDPFIVVVHLPFCVTTEIAKKKKEQRNRHDVKT